MVTSLPSMTARRAVASASMIVSALRDSGVHVTPSRVEAAPMHSTGQRMSRPWATRLWPSMTAWSQPTRTGAEGLIDQAGLMSQPVT